MTGSFASGANVSLVAKNGTKKIIPLLSIKSIKQTPPKRGILIQNTISKFSKPNIKLKKDPLKLKKSKTYIRRPQIKKFYKTDPPKVGILIQIKY